MVLSDVLFVELKCMKEVMWLYDFVECEFKVKYDVEFEVVL